VTSTQQATTARRVDALLERLAPTTVAWAMAAVAFVLALVATVQGPGITPDGVNYLSAGINLSEGDGLLAYNGDTLTVFPPGMPVIAAAGETIGIGAEQAIRFVNAFAFAGAVLLGSMLLRRHVRSSALVMGATVLLGVSLPLLLVAQMALSEPLFIVLCLASILVLEEVLTRDRLLPWLAAAAGLVWLAFLFRYTGVALIASGGLTILIGLRTKGWGRALAAGVGFGVASLVVPLAWMARNHDVDGTLLGPRVDSPYSPFDVLERYLITLGGWLLPPPTPERLQQLAGAVFAVAAVATFVWLFRTRQRQPDALALVLFPIVYGGYVAAGQLATWTDPADNRLLSPVYVPLVVLGAMALERWAVPARARLPRQALVAATVVLLAYVGVVGLRTAAETADAALNGKAFADQSFQDSEVFVAAADLPADADVYSNVADGMWTVLRREPLRAVPTVRPVSNPDDVQPVDPEFLATVACAESYLVWSEHPLAERTYLATPDELAEVLELEVVSETADGTVYRMTDPAGATDCA
jgi:hypothetical protein